MRPIYPNIEISNEEFLSTVIDDDDDQAQVEGFEVLSRTACDPHNGVGEIQIRALNPEALKRFLNPNRRTGPDYYPLFANTGRIVAFDRKKVLWLFDSNVDKRFQGRLPGRLYVFADYFGKVLKTSWAKRRELLPYEFLHFLEAPIPTPPTVRVALPLGKVESL